MKIQLRTPKSQNRDKWQATSDKKTARTPLASCQAPLVTLAAPKRSEGGRHSSAFTLVEMLLVITIIGILAALVIPKMVGRSEQARQAAAHADLSSVKTALDAFEVDNGYYPKNLQDLLQQPNNAKNWHGPYLDKVPQDPWGNNYLYYYPGKHNQSSYDLLSIGPDSKEGSEDDIGNWTSK
jgi:general secretion pathway protein G